MRELVRCIAMAAILHVGLSFGIHRHLASSNNRMTTISRFASKDDPENSVFFEEPQEEIVTPQEEEKKVVQQEASPQQQQQMSQQQQQRTASPPPMQQPQRIAQPPPPQQTVSSTPRPVRRQDPLIAALTKNDVGGSKEMINVPFLGEIPADEGVLQFAVAGVVALLGFGLSLVVAYQSRDIFLDGIAKMSNNLNNAASLQPNQVYDDQGCRGICSSQEESLESMSNFMQAISKKR